MAAAGQRFMKQVAHPSSLSSAAQHNHSLLAIESPRDGCALRCSLVVLSLR